MDLLFKSDNMIYYISGISILVTLFIFCCVSNSDSKKKNKKNKDKKDKQDKQEKQEKK